MYRVFIIIICFFLNFPGFALENLDIYKYSVASGLPSNEVFSIEQDDLGFIWFGTRNGLCRYDGYQFKTYYLNRYIDSYEISNSIIHLKKDKTGNMWIVLENNKVYLFNPKIEIFTNIPIKYNLKTRINSLLITDNGEIYLGTGEGILSYDKSSFGFIFKRELYIKSLFEDSKGRIWIGTWNKGFYLFDEETNNIIHYRIDDKNIGITCFAEDKQGNIWISTWDGKNLYCLQEPDNPVSTKIKKYKVKVKDSVFPSGVIYGLLYDDNNDDMWVYTANGVVIISLSEGKDSFKYLNYQEIGGTEVWTMFKDNKGAIWGSIVGGGVLCLKYSINFYGHTVPEFFSDKIITALYEDNDSILWVGSRNKTLQFWNIKSNNCISYKDVNYLKDISDRSNSVVSITACKTTEDIWLGTRYEGVYCVKRKEGMIIGLEKPDYSVMHTQRISVLKSSQIGKVWIGTESGLYYANNSKEIQEINELNKFIEYDTVLDLYCKDDDLWIATKYHGVVLLNKEGKITSFYCRKVNITSPSCFYKDSYGKLWLGTHGSGLYYYDEKLNDFVALEMLHLFSEDFIYSIQGDNDNNLWIATGRGLFILSLSNNNVIWYNQKDKLNNLQFVNGVSLFTTDKKVLFGGYNGIDCYIKNNIEKNSIKESSVFIVDISLMNVPISELKTQGIYVSDMLPPYTNSMSLDYNQNNLTFEFSCLSFANSSANRYAYRLVGIDKDWIYVDSNNRNISYNALPKGEYCFEVKACEGNGVWSDTRKVRIVIHAAPWLSLWAYIVYILLTVIVFCISFYRIRRRIKLQHTLQIEHLEHKKSEEVNQAKLNFFTNVSHELFTPISVLQCSIDKLVADKTYDNETLYIMKANLKRLHRLLQQILEFRKIESGNLKLKVSLNDIVLFTRRLCEENFAPLAESKQINLHFASDPDIIMGYFDIDKLDKILYNLISNALKYNYRNGVISVSLCEEYNDNKRYVRINIENTGDGIPESRIPYLFKRFYDGDYRKFKTKGNGIGLSLTKDLVDLHNGSIEVSSTIGEITVFSLKLPVDKESYNDNQIEEVVTDISPFEVFEDVENHNSVHILIVEDDADLLSVMTKFMSLSFSVHTASNGVEALKILSDCDNIELLVTDYVMPEMDGILLCKSIRENKELNHLPIIMLTAKTQVESQLEGYNSGVDAYISKPVEMNVLMAQIRTLLNNRKLVIERFRYHESTDIKELGLNQQDQQFLDQAISVVEDNIEDPDFSTELFSEKMNMSQSTLYRKLKLLTGMSANEFIRNVRIKKSCELLLMTGKSVLEVAYMVGFSDPRYFGIVFKKEIGVSPSKYVDTVNKK